jgi:hypothetical protein
MNDVDTGLDEQHERKVEIDRVVETSHEVWDETIRGVRKLGILDDDRLREALHDPRTLTVKLDDGRRVASLLPIEFADGAGYDVDRCVKEIVKTDKNVWAYMNAGDVLQNATEESFAQLIEKLQESGEGYIFYTVSEHDDPNDNAETELGVLLHDAGLQTSQVEIRDDEAAQYGEQHAEASLSLFRVDVPAEARTDVPASIELLYETYLKGVREGRYPHDTENGVAVLRGVDISDELADQLWEIYDNRLGWLGGDHPISMEDTKEETLPLIRGKNTLLSIRFKDGKPVCFTDFIGDTDEIAWLSPDFLHDDERMQRTESQKIVFFPGIVSAEAGANYSMDVIGVLADMGLDSGGSYKVVFENTNKSEIYIPKIVQDVINGRGKEQVKTPEVVDRTYYRCIRYSPTL